MRIAALLGANALLLCIGLGALALLGVARSWRQLGDRAGLAYLCGLALGGIVAAELALARLAFGWTALGVLASASLGAGALRLRGSEGLRFARPAAVPLAGAAATIALLVDYGRQFPVQPLDSYCADSRSTSSSW